MYMYTSNVIYPFYSWKLLYTTIIVVQVNFQIKINAGT